MGLTYFYRDGLFFSSFNLDEVILTLSSQNVMVQDYSLFQPLEQSDHFFDIWDANRTYGSIDPGFFTLILHYWSLISSKTLWLRLLPFGFFLGSLFLLIKLATPEKGKLYYGLFPLFLVFGDQLLMDHAYTVRPYAMEMMGTFFLFAFLFHFNGEWRRENILMMVILSFFLGSRYYFWINASFAGLSFLWVEWARASKTLKFKEVIKLFSIPTIVGIVLLLFTYSYQIENLDIAYMDVNYDPANPWFTEVLKDINFRYLLSYPLFILFFKRRNLSDQEMKVISFLTLSFVGYVLLSVLKISPFRVGQRFTIGYHVVAVVSCALFLKEIFLVLWNNDRKISLVVSLVALSFTLNNYFLFVQQSDLVPIVKELEGKKDKLVYCDVVSCSMIRFLRDFTGYDVNWEEMPQFKMVSHEDVEKINQDKFDYFLVIAPTGNLGRLSQYLEKQDRWTMLIGKYYQRLYQKH